MKKLVMAAVLICFSFSAYAMEVTTPAGKLDLYASIRAYAMFQDISDSDSYRDINEVKFALQSNSRIGTRWTYDDFFAHFELGINGTNNKLRQLYGGYNIGGGEYGRIKVGQFPTVADTQETSSRRFDTDNGLVGFGAVGQVRRPGVSYEYGGFTIGLSTINSEDSDTYTNFFTSAGTMPDPSNPAATIPLYGDVRYRELVPKIELQYNFKEFFPARIFGAFAYVTADAVDNANGGSEEDYDATGFHVGAEIFPQINDIYIRLSGFYAVNAGLYGQVKTGNGKGGAQNALPTLKSNGDLEDTSTYGGTLVVGYKVSPMVTVELGGGYQVSENDTWAEDDDNWAIYLNAPIKPVRHITIIPEIGYLDYMKRSDGSDDAKVIQAGAQIRFDI